MNKRNVLILLLGILTLASLLTTTSCSKDGCGIFDFSDRCADLRVINKIYKTTKEKSYGLKTLQDLCKNNKHRMTGTKFGEKSEEYIFNEFKKLGIDVKYMPFDMNVWTRQWAKLTILIPEKKKEKDKNKSENKKTDKKEKKVVTKKKPANNKIIIPTLSFAYTPEYSDLKGEIIDIGEGLDEDFDFHGKDIEGKIVLMNLQVFDKKLIKEKTISPPRSYKAKLAVEYGATGIIFINKYGGYLLQTGTTTLDSWFELPIPALCVTYYHGKKIRKLLEEHGKKNELLDKDIETTDIDSIYSKKTDEKKTKNKTDKEKTETTKKTETNKEKNVFTYLAAELKVRNRYVDKKPRNIIATIPGSSKDKRKIVLGGHYDTWDVGPGAVDNGIGAITIFETARLFKELKLKSKRTIEFVLWVGEEHGLMGSKAYLKKHLKNKTLDKIGYYVNIDMHGKFKGFDAMGRKEIMPFLEDVGKDLSRFPIGFKEKHRSAPNAEPYSDYLTFMMMGIPVIQPVSGLKGGVYAYYHTRMDEAKLLDDEQVNASVVAMTYLMYKLGNLEKIPSKRMSFQDTWNLMLAMDGKKVLLPEYNWNMRKKIDLAMKVKKNK